MEDQIKRDNYTIAHPKVKYEKKLNKCLKRKENEEALSDNCLTMLHEYEIRL
jgi:hypothetical protein